MKAKSVKAILAAAIRAVMAAAAWAVISGAVATGAEQLWLLSTRRAPQCCLAAGDEQPVDYWRLEDGSRWVEADQDAFLATDDPAVPTTIFVHGNRVGPDEAVRMGWQVYQRLKCAAAGRPLRMVVWSWPSQRIRGRNRRDVQVKASRSDVESYYLGCCIDRINPAVKINLVGYSFGARAITGALELLAGGQVAGRSLPQRNTAGRRPLHAVLIAAALDADWLLPGRRNGQALTQVDRMLVTCNSCDPVLRLYRSMYRVRGPQALGFAGPACAGELGADQEKLELLSLSCSVGKIHDWDVYISAPALASRLAGYAFLEPAEAPTASGSPL